MIDLRKIKKLIELVEESQIASLKISENGETIEISKPVMQMTAPAPIMGHHVTAAPAPTHVEKPSVAAASQPAHQETLNSPMVGTVYLSATPGADPFVDIGQVVKKGQVICLVEAMKMYNQIEADKEGTITARLIENASPVEFGQPLFMIE